MIRVAVVGGGLAGLSAAWRLAEGGASVLLLEGSGSMGGQVRTLRERQCVIELGAEGFPAARGAVPALAAAFGLAEEIVPQRELPTLLLRGGRMAPLAPGEGARRLGMQVDEADLGRGLRTFRGGMGSLVGALESWVRQTAEVRLGWEVQRVSPESGRLTVAGAGACQVDAAVIATAPDTAARLFGIRPPAGLALADCVTVTLCYDRGLVRAALEATGFILDRTAGDGFRACTFVTAKFPRHVPPHLSLFRVFFRPRHAWRSEQDGAWVDRAHARIGPLLGIGGPPAEGWVARWPRAMPEPGPGYAEEVRDLRRTLRARGSIELAGAALDGAGVDGAVRSGLAAADRLLHRLRPGEGPARSVARATGNAREGR